MYSMERCSFQAMKWTEIVKTRHLKVKFDVNNKNKLRVKIIS